MSKMVRNIHKKTAFGWLTVVLAMIGTMVFSGCDEQIPSVDDLLTSVRDSVEAEDTEGLKVTDVKFSENYKTVEFAAKQIKDIPYDLTDSSEVRIDTEHRVEVRFGQTIRESKQPRLIEVKNIGQEEVSAMNMKLMVLVDLSLPQHLVDAQKKAIKEMKMLFSKKNLCVSFMNGDNVSETYVATDYIINNYFKHKDPSYTYLYRSVLEKMDEMDDGSDAFANVPFKAIVVFSDGKTYNGNRPIDPRHFEIQEQLTQKAETDVKDNILVYYANFSDSLSVDNNADILQMLCKEYHGVYQNSFLWSEIMESLMNGFGVDYENFRLKYEFPDGQLFRGNRQIFNIEFHDAQTDKLLMTGNAHFYLGSFYNPIIVNGFSFVEVILQGILIALIIASIIYLILQFIVPRIRYKLFLKNYVTTYTGRQMSFNGHIVGESCYLCKAPFEEGDVIVAKCKHTMHKDCWDENDYHCPEHGRQCMEGSHYYNQHNLFDTRNATFYLKWTLVAILAGLVAWIEFTLNRHDLSVNLVQKIVLFIYNLEPGTAEAENMLSEYASHLDQLPSFGLTVGFFVTFFLSLLSVRNRHWAEKLTEVFVRSVCAGVLSYLCFLLECITSIVLGIDKNMLIIEWIPWALMNWVIMFAVTYNTRIIINKKLLLVVFLIGFLSMYVWAGVYPDSYLDYRLSVLLGFLTYAVGLALCIAKAAPKSERFFLRVEGSIKEMDIALYKWMKTDSSYAVTIGKSVECSLQMSWDVTGNISPVQAEIKQRHGGLRLYALEEGVIVGQKPLKVGSSTSLYHGKKFSIGQTTFTYIEKDL